MVVVGTAPLRFGESKGSQGIARTIAAKDQREYPIHSGGGGRRNVSVSPYGHAAMEWA